MCGSFQGWCFCVCALVMCMCVLVGGTTPFFSGGSFGVRGRGVDNGVEGLGALSSLIAS